MVDPTGSPLTDKQRRTLKLLDAARGVFAPEMTTMEYYEAIKTFENTQMYRVKNPPLEERVNDDGDIIGPPDNSGIFETLTYRYRGMEAVQELLADDQPVAFVGWHHGAREHVDYALARSLPDLAMFTRRTVQYGTVLSIPMGRLGLVKMHRFLESGRPIFYFLDGAPQGECVQLSVLGTMGDFSITPIRMFQSAPGLRIVPVHSFYAGETAAHVNFLPALGIDGKLADMDEKDILAELFEQLQDEQRKRAPSQVLINYPLERDRLAREANEARERERQKTI